MVTLDYHPPDTAMEIIKAIFDILTVVAFIALLVIVFYARMKFPLFAKKGTFIPLLSFSILGIISTTMDAIDEFYWFISSSETFNFYDHFWKPTRLGLLLLACILLIITFIQFYRFSKRLLGDES